MRAILQHRLASVPVMTAVVLLLPLLFPSGYYYRVAALVFVFALAATGLNLLMGLAGQVSLGHAGFMGIGAYAVAVGPTHLGVPSWLAFVMGAALSALVAYLVGRPILRLKGHYLAVATLGFGLLLAIVFSNEAGFTGGPDGMSVPRLVLFGWSLRGPDTWYWITAASFLIGATLALNLIDSPSGRALRAIHDSEVAARVLGVDVARKKLAVFVLSAIYASVAGSYFALLNGHITPDVSGFLRSIELVAMVVLGGMGSIAGSLVGAALLVVLPQTLTFLHDYEHMVLGLIVMAVMIFLRAGIVPTRDERAGGEARMTILVTEHLSIAFGGVRAVDDVSLAIAPGIVFSIIGPNGAGKTTLFNIISGLYLAQHGRVRLAGEDVSSLAPEQLARRGLSRTFQNLQIFFRMTALENVMVGRHRHERTGIFADLLHLPAVGRQNLMTRDAAMAALERVGLAAAAQQTAGSLSFGGLKRLEMARALASEPKVLLLDEPAAGCNPVETAEIEAIIRRLTRDGITVVLVEHDMRLVMNVSDRVHVLANGRTLAEGTAAEVRANPAVIEAYLGVRGARESTRAVG